MLKKQTSENKRVLDSMNSEKRNIDNNHMYLLKNELPH